MWSYIWRVFATLLILFIWYTTQSAYNIGAAPVVNEIASHQFEGGYEWQKAMAGTQVYSLFLKFGTVIYITILFFVWFGKLVDLFEFIFMPTAALALVIGLGTPDAHAYRFKSDWSEMVTAGAGDTVFLVPLFGDKLKQGVMKSEQFYKDNLVSSQYVLIPHCQIPGTGTLFNDYVNCSQAIFVRRMPVAREWTHNASTGSSQKDESFRCETAQSHEIATDITFAAMIKEEDAAKYLYYVSADPNRIIPTSQSGTDMDKDRNFVSAIESVPLSVFTDTYIRRIVGSEICAQMSSRATDDVIKDKNAIISDTKKKVTEELKNYGVTVIALGFAGPLTLDKRVQASIDDTYISEKRAIAANNLMKAMPALEAQARIDVMHGLAEMLRNGKIPALPSFVGAIPPELIDGVKSFMTGAHKQ